MADRYPRLGTGVVILNKHGQILFGKRLNQPLGWSIPGGHVEFGENLIDCAKREVMEEVGIEIENVEPLTFGENLLLDQDYHSVSIFLFSTIKDGEIIGNPEPHKCGGWEWFDITDIPSSLSFNYDPLLNEEGLKILSDYKKKYLDLKKKPH